MKLSDKIEIRAVSSISPSKNNPRKHPTDQIEKLRLSMREFGFTIPILCDEDGVIIAGHGRYEAARLEGLESVPVIYADGWSDDQCAAYMIADNALTDASKWDTNILKDALLSLSDSGVDLTTTMLDDKVLRGLQLGGDVDPPDEFDEHDENKKTDYTCPKCGHQWSGKPSHE
jgi:ParB-like chromosome segregation protein Spo0J